MEIAFIFYVLISIIIISGSAYLNRRSSSRDAIGYSWQRSASDTGRRSSPIVMGILFLLVFVFFGLRWFTTSGNYKIVPQISTTWPPPNSINVCPDYTALSIDKSTTPPTYTCKDINGIAAPPQGGTPSNILALNTSTGWRSTADLCADCYRNGFRWESICIPNSNAPIRADIEPPRPA